MNFHFEWVQLDYKLAADAGLICDYFVISENKNREVGVNLKECISEKKSLDFSSCQRDICKLNMEQLRYHGLLQRLFLKESSCLTMSN